MLRSPRLAALASNFPAAARAPSLTGGRSHDSPTQFASPLASLNPCFPYNSLFQEFGQKRKVAAATTFRLVAPSAQTERCTKDAAGSRDPAALPGASPGAVLTAPPPARARLELLKKAVLQAPPASRTHKRQTKATASSNQRARASFRSRPSHPHAHPLLQ